MIFINFIVLLFSMIFFFYLEKRRVTFLKRADSCTLFILLFYIQIFLPLVIFNLNFIFSAGETVTGNYFFDKVLNDLDSLVLSTVTIISVLFFLLTYSLFLYATPRLAIYAKEASYVLIPRRNVLLSISLFGVLSGLILINILSSGQGFLVGYANLISFRSLSDIVERDFINSNMFSLTQSFLFFSVLLLFSYAKKKESVEFGKRKYILFLLIIILAAFCVSRRSFLIPVLLWYMTFLLLTCNIKVFSILKLLFPLFILVFLGKELLSIFSGASSNPIDVASMDVWSAILKVFCDIGITNIESFATLMYMNDFIRLGQDHIYSLLHRLPDGMLGLDIGLPERIVRISTEIFTDKYQADIPPGFVGQMWLDFLWAGPIVYSAFFSVLLLLVEAVRRVFNIDSASCSLFSLLIFIFCLPLNSGSLDFNFSIDIIFVLLLLPLCYKVKRII